LDHLGRVAYLLILAVCLLGALLFAVLRSAQSDLSAVAKAG
jgi:hypothetical protein